ncbi:MAG: hypothetical protein NTV32_07865 [Gammaproteobacteria bacterium]|jgi:hypothetical protein|nr:hypothetical protein [Gammaproteobacteria bacterium]
MKWFTKLLYCFDKKERAFVSDADRLLQNFDLTHPEKSASQAFEIAKHHAIFKRKVDQRIDWS